MKYIPSYFQMWRVIMEGQSWKTTWCMKLFIDRVTKYRYTKVLPKLIEYLLDQDGMEKYSYFPVRDKKVDGYNRGPSFNLQSRCVYIQSTLESKSQKGTYNTNFLLSRKLQIYKHILYNIF